MSQSIYKLYSNCLLVKGAGRSTICDVQRNRIHFMPNSFAALVTGDHINTELIFMQLDEHDQALFREYLDYLLDQELIFACEPQLLDHFSLLPDEWDFPAHISNAILDAYHELDYCTSELLYQLEILCCRYLQLRYYRVPSKTELLRVMKLIMPGPVKAIDLVIAADPNDREQEQWLIDFVNTNRKIRCLTIHSAGKNEKLQQEHNGFSTIIKIKEQILDQSHCGVIHHAYFSVNIETYTEAQNYNSCLNRKIAIDASGNIRNCPGMSKSYGHIRDTRLTTVAKMPEFQKIWHIRKDDITKCKDCEFRYVCIDCRAYLEHPQDLYAAPLKCGYDPYTCQWEPWSQNPLKKAVIDYYGIWVAE